MDSVFTAPDARGGFTHLALEHPWLVGLESRARSSRIESVEDLHLALTWVHVTCLAHLPHEVAIVADLHLGRILDYQAELHWRVTA